MLSPTTQPQPAATACSDPEPRDPAAAASRDGLLVRHLAPGYVALLVAAEFLASLTRRQVPWAGLIGYGAVLLLFVFHAALYRERRFHFLPLALAFVPAVRLLLWAQGVAIPAGLSCFLSLGLPLLAATVVALWLLGLLNSLRFHAEALQIRLFPLWRRARSCWTRRVPLGLSIALLVAGFSLPAGLVVIRGAHRGGRPPAAQTDGRRRVGAIEPGAAGVGHPARERDSRLGRPGGQWTGASSGTPVLGGDVAEMHRDLLVWRDPAAGDAADRSSLVSVLPAPVAVAGADRPGCPAAGYANPYTYGVCTWYVKEKRPDLPAFSGDAGMAMNWPDSAGMCGFRVDREPEVGAVIVFPAGANGADWGGHVAYVEEVAADSILISECNVTHNSLFNQRPWWWEGDYACAFRRISFERLNPEVQYIHGQEEPSSGYAPDLPGVQRAEIGAPELPPAASQRGSQRVVPAGSPPKDGPATSASRHDQP